MEDNKKVSGALKTHLLWPLILTPFLVIMTLQLYYVGVTAGIVGSVYLGVYIIIALILYNFNKSSIMSNMINYAQGYNTAQKHLIYTMDIPYAHIDSECNIIWSNDKFKTLVDSELYNLTNMTAIFPDVTSNLLPEHSDNISDGLPVTEKHIVFNDYFLKVIIKRLDLHELDFAEDEENLSLFRGSDVLFSVYLYDETELVNAITRLNDQDIVMGLLYIDNYEDSLANCDEMQRSLLMALVEREISKYIQALDGIYRKLEKDRYFIIFQHKYLENAHKDKFAILDAVRNVTVGNDDTHVTISIGLGIHADSYIKRYEYARTAIDLALGRGGDQAVIKDGENIFYYGGNSVQKDNNTRVRARVKAHALHELMLTAGQVYIMGHSNCDIDSFGASVGIYRIARSIERKARIIIDPEDISSIKPMYSKYTASSYYDGFSITPDEAEAHITPDTLLVVVDVNRASLTQCPALFGKTKNIVVIDHHRQTDDRILNQTLSYIEPFASSASEMVTEFFQYIGDGIRPRPLEADTLYAGIMVDTNNFSVQTNVRSFEAVAYLKRNGADITRVRKTFRSEPSEYMLRAHAVSNAEIYRDSFAITRIPTGSTGNPSVIGAKVANSLLDMENIKASFVLSEHKSRIHINARSIDEVNVQIIMEKLGGGGHLSVAATQLDCPMEVAVEQLKNVLDKMIEEGDLL